MRKIKLTTLLLLVFLLLKTSLLLSNTEESSWKQFIENPNKENYALCAEMIHNSLYGPYQTNEYGEKINTPTHLYLIDEHDLYGKFLVLVRKMNPYAVELAFQLYPLTDGAAAEDLFRSIGTIIKVKPEFFLSMLKQYEIKDENIIKHMILMYPLEEVVDNLQRRIEETEERITAFKKVEKEEFSELREQCIDILSSYLTRLRKIEE